MSDGRASPPPPGWQPPPAPPPAYPGSPLPPGFAGPGSPPPHQPGYPPLHHARPVYKPGTIPLRPLGVSDMFGGAIETIRRNPKATVGVAALVLTCLLAIPLLGAFVWGSLTDFGGNLATSDELDGSSPDDIGLAVSVYGGTLFVLLATFVLTGMVVHVVDHAARGQKLSAADAWRLTRSRIWRLIGLSLLPFVLLALVILAVIVLIVVAGAIPGPAGVLVGIVGVIGAVLGLAFLYTRLFLLAAPSLVLEQRGVFSAIGRSWELSRAAFWRLFGVLLLTQLVSAVAAQFIGLPFGLLGIGAVSLVPDAFAAVMAILVAQFVSQIVSGSLTTPFSASIAALQYLDQRIRKEGYDIALISQLPGMPAPGFLPGPPPGAPPGPPPGAPPGWVPPPPPPPPPPYGAPVG